MLSLLPVFRVFGVFAASWPLRWLPAGAALALATWMAAHHPLAPWAALALVAMVACTSWRRPWWWLFAVPAGLPWLNLAPWTGWQPVEEFDLWMLAWWAGAWLRLGPPVPAAVGPPPQRDLAADRLVGLLAVSAALGIARGLMDAGSVQWGWFGDYTDPSNTWRVAKSLLYAVLWWPLMRRAVACSRTQAGRLLAWGVFAGLVVVVCICVWERYAYTRLFDFRYVYRTTALFWEMHVGGGAIDVYLALAWPMAWWAVRVLRHPAARMAAMLLLLGVVYACASTFSRGVYVGVLAGALVLAALGIGSLRRRGQTSAQVGIPFVLRPAQVLWLSVAASVLVAAVVLLMAVLGPRSFMFHRLATTTDEVDGRWAQWGAGVASLRSADEWLFGRGLGRIPSMLHALDDGAWTSGAVRWEAEKFSGDVPHVTVEGPRLAPDLRGLYALTQRVPILPGRRYRVDIQVRSAKHAVLQVEVCERHLLYDRRCQGRILNVPDTGGAWLVRSLQLQGPAFGAAPALAPRLGMLGISVPATGVQVDLRSVQVHAAERSNLLDNGQFLRELAHWFPAAQFHFLPWHLDSLYVETLVERGASGFLLLLATLGLAAWRLVRAEPSVLGGCLAASLASAMVVGGASSVFDAPRVATLFWFCLFFTLCWTKRGRPTLVPKPSQRACSIRVPSGRAALPLVTLDRS